MIFFYDVLQGGVNLLKDVPVKTGGTTLVKGAAVIRGVTTGTNRGGAIVGSGALADVVGVLEQKYLGTATDSDFSGGTVLAKARCSVNPMGVYLAEWSQATADTIQPTSDSAIGQASLNFTSVEDVGGGWAYNVTTGELQFIVGASTNALTAKANLATDWATSTYVVKMVPKFHTLGAVNSTADKLASTIAAGTAQIVVLENYIQALNIPFQPLDPAKHSGLVLLNQNVKLYSEIMFRDHLLNKRL